MMKKKLFVLLTVVCILALATACGSQTSGTDTDSNAGTQSGAQQEESTLHRDAADRQAGREKGLYVCCDG